MPILPSRHLSHDPIPDPLRPSPSVQVRVSAPPRCPGGAPRARVSSNQARQLSTDAQGTSIIGESGSNGTAEASDVETQQPQGAPTPAPTPPTTAAPLPDASSCDSFDDRPLRATPVCSLRRLLSRPLPRHPIRCSPTMRTTALPVAPRRPSHPPWTSATNAAAG